MKEKHSGCWIQNICALWYLFKSVKIHLSKTFNINTYFDIIVYSVQWWMWFVHLLCWQQQKIAYTYFSFYEYLYTILLYLFIIHVYKDTQGPGLKSGKSLSLLVPGVSSLSLQLLFTVTVFNILLSSCVIKLVCMSVVAFTSYNCGLSV